MWFLYHNVLLVKYNLAEKNWQHFFLDQYESIKYLFITFPLAYIV
jgi:hypothetical protein